MTVANPSTALALVVVDELVRNGVTRFVMAPGSRSTPLVLAAASHPDVVLHVEVDERSAGFFALGVGRETGRPAAVVTTSGSAAVNLHSALVEADHGRVPLLALTADRPPELHGVGANQTIGQQGLFGPSPRWATTLGPAEDRPQSNRWWRSSVCRAVAEASGAGSPPGPVHLNLAFREPLIPLTDDGRTAAAAFASPIDGRPEGEPWTRYRSGEVPTVVLPTSWVGEERGLVVAGDLGPCLPSAPVADALAARLGWPLLAEPTAGFRPSQTISPLVVSHPGFADRYHPEVVLVVGRAVIDRDLDQLLARSDVLVADPWGWPDPRRSAVEMVAGIPSVPSEVPPRRSGWRRDWMEADRAVRAAVGRCLDGFNEPTEPRVARDVAAFLGEDDRLVVASSMPVRDLDRFMVPGRVRIHTNRGASGIDGFVSTVLGVASAHRGRTLGLAGDLAMLHDAGGLAVDPRPDAVFVVVDNDGGGIFSFLPQARLSEHFERLFGTPHGRSFAALARLHDAGYRRAAGPGEVGAALVEAFGEGGVQLVEVPGDRERNVAVHRRLAEVAAAALDGWLQR